MARSAKAAENRHIVKDHPDCPAGKPWALVAKSSGKVLGCHPTETAAAEQEAAIKANEQHARVVEEIRAALPQRERRYLQARGTLELRRSDQGPQLHMMVPYNSESAPLGGFREMLRPGVFSKTLQEQDIASLWNHDPNWVLGRTGNRMLALLSTDQALEGTVQLDGEDQMHQHFARRVDRGDVTGTSFGFEKVRDSWDGTASDGLPLRSLLEARLSDVSPVTFPAYPESAAEKRSLLDIASVRAGVDLAALAAALAAVEEGYVPEAAAAAVRSQVDRIVAMLPPPPRPGMSDADRRRRLHLAELVAFGEVRSPSDPTTVQTYIFPKAHWTSAEQVKKWLGDHSYHTGLDETNDSWRARQRPPGDFVEASFRTICLTGASDPGHDACRIKAVVGHLAEAKAA